MEWHVKLEYHGMALSKLTEFVARFEHPSKAIQAQFHTELQCQMEDNLAVVESLLKIMLCGK